MKLIVEIDLGEQVPGKAMSDSGAANALRLLANRIGNPDIGIEAVNCTSVLNANGQIVGEVYLSDEDS